MKSRIAAVLGAWVLCPGLALADGSTIGKIYQPYVQPLEKEIEYIGLVEDDSPEVDRSRTRHQMAVGAALSDQWFAEGLVTYVDEPSYELSSYELELRRQLTEQGQYDSDWGLMLELEKLDGVDAWEAAVGVLNTRDWRRWQLTANLFLIQEWGGDVQSELETAFAFQGKYRYRPALEPGFELFLSQDTRAIGPVVGGQLRLSGTDKLYWQLAFLVGCSNRTADQNVKLQLEYEFY